MAHLDPHRLETAMVDAGVDAAALALASGIRADFVTDALDGTRRLGGWAMRALAGPLHVEWTSLRCEHASGARRCRGCRATNQLSDADLAPLAESIADVLEAMYADGRDPADIDATASAEAALRALGGGELDDAWTLADVLNPTTRAKSGGTAAIAQRLAAYVARGDADTIELVGLDIAMPTHVEVSVAGWTLGRLPGATQVDFDPIPALPRSAFWDSTATYLTAWLRRPVGSRPAVSRTTITVSDPHTVAVAPLLALAIVGDEPPRAISHAWAQPGRGVSFATGSRQLDYFEHTDGYLEGEYGPYRIEQSAAAAWSDRVQRVGDVVGRAFAANGNTRFVDAAEQLLTIAADFHLGWDPLPRLAVEMSTALEILVLDGGNTGEPTRRVTFATTWLAGIDDKDRAAIEKLTKRMYEAGSAYRHGGSRFRLHRTGPHPDGKKVLDITTGYRLLRRLLLHGAFVLAAGENIAELCDRAQISEAARQRLAEVISDGYIQLDQPLAPMLM